MDVKEFWINGKAYNMTKIAELLSSGNHDKAKFSFDLMTGLSGDESEHFFSLLKKEAENNVSDFKRFPINGYFYNVETVMDNLSEGDAFAAFESLKSLGLDDDSCKAAIPRLMNVLEDYQETRKEKQRENQSDKDFQIVKQRELDQNWYAPARCPNCGEVSEWLPQGQAKGGFSAGKAVAGAVLLGPIGLAAGALGKKQTVYQCGKCGYTSNYSVGSKRWDDIKKKF